MATVNDGAKLYRDRKAGHQVDPEQVYRAKPGTTDWGRLLRRAQDGDQRARDIVARRDARGDDLAADVLEGAGTGGTHITRGTQPGDFTVDQVS